MIHSTLKSTTPRLMYQGEAVYGLREIFIGFDSNPVQISGSGILLTHYKYPIPIQLKLSPGTEIEYDFNLSVSVDKVVITHDTNQPIINIL